MAELHDRIKVILPLDESQTTDSVIQKAQEIHRQKSRPGRVAWHTLAEYFRAHPSG